MSVKLRFLDTSRNPLHEGDISQDWLSPLPKIGEVVVLPDGVRVKTINRQYLYSMAAGPATDVVLVYETETF